MKKVYFIGAGPGDPELITVKGQKIVKEADVIIYAGSLVPKEVIDCHKDDGSYDKGTKKRETGSKGAYWGSEHLWCNKGTNGYFG